MRHKIELTAILLIAAGFRLIGLNNVSPPGLAHDEVANWLIDRSILAGNHAVYFTEAYGHEAGFHYWQTLFVALFGDNALALRLPAAFAGLLLVAVTYTLIKKLLGRDVALVAMGITAVLFMPIFYSRLALRAITLPLLSGLSAYFWWAWWMENHGDKGTKVQGRLPLSLSPTLLVSALLAGASTYTYMASRALPIFWGFFFVYLALAHWGKFKQRWGGLLMFGGVYTAVSWPLVRFIQQVPDAEFRISEVDAPMRAFLAGDLWPALQNAWAILWSVGVEGDLLWRQNVSGVPIFEPVLAISFYLGALVIIWHWKDAVYAFFTLWISCAIIPSVMTINAPSFIRMVNIIPVLGVFPAVLLVKFVPNLVKYVTKRPRTATAQAVENLPVIHNPSTFSTVIPQLSTVLGENPWITLLTLLILLFYGGRTRVLLFDDWPNNREEVRFVWQASLTEMAAYIDNRPEINAATIIGWTPETMDPPTMMLTLRRDNVAVRHAGQVGEVQTIIVPHDPAGDSYIFRPTELPLNFFLEQRLIGWGGEPQQVESFTLYKIEEMPEPRPQYAQSTQFGDELQLIGYDLALLPPFDQFELVTYWRVLATPNSERRFFMHMRDLNGEMLGQFDGLTAPAKHWQVGDLILQYHALPNTNIPFDIQLGVYEPAPPWPRLTTAEGADHVIVGFDSN